MKIKKPIKVQITVQERNPGPISPGDRKDLTDFFLILLEWDLEQESKEQIDRPSL